jgi:methylated-DNA-[protein]-cysteine S-methyltransferase
MALEATPRGISRIVLPRAGRRAAERALGAPRAARRSSPPRAATSRLKEARAQILEFLAGRRRRLAFPLDLSDGTPFQRRVWRAIRAIPYGRVRSYQWAAERVGGARYARAVGLALGANPVPLIVPCHRILASDGSLGGFTGGLATKRRLLALERDERRTTGAR